MKRSPMVESPASESLSLNSLASFFNLLEQPLLVSDRAGRFLLATPQGEKRLAAHGIAPNSSWNLFADLLQTSPRIIEDQIEAGEQKIDVKYECCSGSAIARVRWLPDQDWLVVTMESKEKQIDARPAPATQHTVQELLQEREITYRNLLAAYLRLQEVNRQKTVFLASAAHELKTPLAVIKGYYDLLLSGSLG
ncbi:MAG: histidine kinase dimerization/phospho-acceptor domain-containing protein, partial [Candidatus Acidiferrales bacterium]